MGSTLSSWPERSQLVARSFEAYMAGGTSRYLLEPGLALSFEPFTSDPREGWRGQRTAEYLAGRTAARDALRSAGHHGPAVLDPVSTGAARWPQGYSGSISHSAGHAAAVAWSAAGAVGIDIEAGGDVPRGALEIFSSKSQLDHLPEVECIDVATLLFSAKEAAFKALSPSSGLSTIRDIEVRFSDSSSLHGRFRAWQRANSRRVLDGFFAATPSLVLTLATARTP